MKRFIPAATLVLLTMVSAAQADPIPEQSQRPCFNVEVQNDPVNRSSVRQNCNRNVSRTVQAGADNAAQTIQIGEINSNKTRQYHYDRSKYSDRIHANQ
jgi:hypothetical protein